MADHVVTNSGLQLTDKTYEALQRLVEKVLPALAVLYAALAYFWGWGFTVEVSGSISALAVFGGVLLSLARKGYSSVTLPDKYDGQVVQGVTETGQTTLRLQLNPDAAADILNKPVINIKGFDASA